MKKILVLVGCLVGGLSAFAQGYVNFANLGTGVNSPFRNVGGATPLSGAGFMVELLTGASQAAVTTSITPLFTGSFNAGFFNGGSRTVPASDVFTSGGNTFTWAMVRVWDSVGGTITTYAAAQNAGHGATLAWQSPVQASATLPAAAMAGMPLINGTGNLVVPEPSTIILGALGAAALLFRRRK